MTKSNRLKDIPTKYKPIAIEENNTIEITKSGIYTISINQNTNIHIFTNVQAILTVEVFSSDYEIHLYLDTNSSIGYYALNKGNTIYTNAFLKENAYLETYEFFTAETSKTEYKVDLLGYNATLQYNAGIYAKGKDNHTHKVMVNHLVPSTHSNINNRAVLNDTAQGNFDVESFIKKGASKSSAYQKSKIINLSDTTLSNVNPVLLIDDYDVMAGHGATVAKISKQDLYYLQSRGLTVPNALKLITLGFLLEIVPEYMLEEIEELIERRMQNA
ncbi:MAG: SufD family Fe-S cluster assembly protein [Bacilli bacterium]|nr:SufD family Fe-S cluster assembly protein [Bacilli bacterium]